MAINKKQLAGRIGEDAACSFLRKKGYQVIARNFRVRNGEIDIIAITKEIKKSSVLGNKSEDILVFVEVKTRLSTDFGTPFEAITHWKMQALVRTAEIYKMTHPQLPEAMRIDAVSVMLDEQNHVLDIEHIESIT